MLIFLLSFPKFINMVVKVLKRNRFTRIIPSVVERLNKKFLEDRKRSILLGSVNGIGGGCSHFLHFLGPPL